MTGRVVEGVVAAAVWPVWALCAAGWAVVGVVALAVTQVTR